VGLDVQLDCGTAYINQSGYITKVVEQFGMTDCRPRYTPMEEGLKLGPGAAETGEHPEPVDKSLYR
jgi:hypothetical protein